MGANKRLGANVCKRPGVKMATLLSGDEINSGGSIAKPSGTEWVNAQLRTFHRGHYIQDRDVRKCHVVSRFRPGVALAIHGKPTKRCPVHIEEALISMTLHPRGLLSRNVIPIVKGEFYLTKPFVPGKGSHRKELFDIDDANTLSQTASRRPSQASMGACGLSGLSIVSGSLVFWKVWIIAKERMRCASQPNGTPRLLAEPDLHSLLVGRRCQSWRCCANRLSRPEI